jgi:hypothetical protein
MSLIIEVPDHVEARKLQDRMNAAPLPISGGART